MRHALLPTPLSALRRPARPVSRATPARRRPARSGGLVRAVAGRAMAVAMLVGLASSALAGDAGLPRSERPEDVRLYLITPVDGETVSSPFVVRFGLSGMGVAPAGVDKANTGHHHLLIDTELPRLDLPVPADDHHRHFGAGQTEVELELEPGQHTLQLLLGDQNHVPHDPPVVSERITITVE